MPDVSMTYSAILSDCGLYRYRLGRTWNDRLGRVVFVILNPSTADHETDDPTIRRCIGFAKAWGFGSLEVVNLYAFRATDPKDMLAAKDPVGPDNDDHLAVACVGAHQTICAWGTKGGDRALEVALRLNYRGVRTMCLGLTKDGHPKHPLYVPNAAELIEFEMRGLP